MQSSQEMFSEPFKARLLRAAWRVSGRKPRVDQFLAGFLRYRKYLRECDARDAIPDFERSDVRIRQCPLGPWSTPLIDVFVIIKAALGFRSKRILELGSYRGDTARLIAENTPNDVTLCTVDVTDDHGASYRDSDVAKRIRRKVGRISSALFDPGEKFDFIFVDANHDVTSVINDTEVAFSVLANPGVILWHDYRQDSYFHGMCGVPEALDHFSRTHAIYAIQGTMLAIYSTFPGWETSKMSSRVSAAAHGT